MTIDELEKKYSLKRDDFWKHEASGNWIVKHDISERIAVIENIELIDIKCLTSEKDLVRFLVTMKKGDRQITSVGEASPNNCTSRYYGCMAEKRGIDRCVLKLIEAYEYGVYSEDEADDFKKPTTQELAIQEKKDEAVTDPQLMLINELTKGYNSDQKLKLDKWLDKNPSKSEASAKIDVLRANKAVSFKDMKGNSAT